MDGMILSDGQILNTGIPQGCALSPIVFSVYTNEITINNDILKLVKHADDMVLVTCLKEEQSLNVEKTDEMALGRTRDGRDDSTTLYTPKTRQGK